MAEPTLTDFVNVLCLRNQLVVLKEEVLLDVYQDYENYLTFLDSVEALSEIDGAFLFYSDEFIKTIYDILQIHRYEIKDPEIRNSINEKIGYLNRVRITTEETKKELKNIYHNYHEKVRNMYIKTSQDLIHYLGYDACVYVAITEGNMDSVTNYEMFLSSINYFIEAIPEIFEDKDVRDRTMTLVNKLSKGFNPSKGKIRRYSQETKENLQKIKIKGE